MADIGKVTKREITAEMRESYLDYAMSVIVSRALPDVRDGLKPVQRRILYALHEMGLGPAAKFRKSAAIVGETLGRYHPHGDLPVYDALARMAQDFSLRYPLIDGQGNWGSIDGDAAAAMRYTEARMTRIAQELLRDIEKDTVGFRENYDGTSKEPVVLPAALPQLLLNGSVGIAVGMATSIPPHNLGEVMDALGYLIEYPGASNDELMEFIPGPDFPTGGIMYNQREIRQAYAAGRGAILVRAKAEIVEKKGGGQQIVVTEIPYQVVKADLIVKIAELVREKKIEGIRDIRDESDREGLSIAIDLKSDAAPQKVLNRLYQATDLEKNFNLNMLALVEGIQPQVLSLKGILEEYLKHREAVIVRRSKFELEKAKERAHILEGLVKAIGDIDHVIQTIKKSQDRQSAHRNLMAGFGFTAAQAAAILEMRLSSLAALERKQLDEELVEKRSLIRELEALLKERKKILARMEEEFSELKKRYADPRRTELVKSPLRAFDVRDIIPEEEVVVVATRGGYIKRMKPTAYRMQKRGGKGVAGIETNEEDVVLHFLLANTHDTLIFFTSPGKVYQIKTYEIPEGSRIAKGKAIHNFLSVTPSERITAILALPGGTAAERLYLSLVTKDGIIKKVAADSFAHVRRSGIMAIQLKSGDELRAVGESTGADDLLLVTKLGQAIRFREAEVRPMGRQASGTRAVRLKAGDEVIGLTVIPSAKKTAAGAPPDRGRGELLVMSRNGFGKRTALAQYKRQRRGGRGIKTIRITGKTGPLVASRLIAGEAELIAISERGQVIRTSLAAVPVLSRSTQGVRIMKLEPGDQVASVTIL